MHAEFGGSRCNFGSFYFYFVIGTFRPSLALLTCDMAKNSAFLLVCFRIKFFRLLIFGSSAQSHASSLEKKNIGPLRGCSWMHLCSVVFFLFWPLTVFICEIEFSFLPFKLNYAQLKWARNADGWWNVLFKLRFLVSTAGQDYCTLHN